MFKGFDCRGCRKNYAENNDPVPCDRGGVAACPYWHSHGASPGARLLDINRLAVMWLRNVKRFGFEQAMAFLDIELTPYQASYLLEAWAIYEDFITDQQRRAR